MFELKTGTHFEIGRDMKVLSCVLVEASYQNLCQITKDVEILSNFTIVAGWSVEVQYLYEKPIIGLFR